MAIQIETNTDALNFALFRPALCRTGLSTLIYVLEVFIKRMATCFRKKNKFYARETLQTASSKLKCTRTVLIYAKGTYSGLLYDVAVIQWITSCHKNHMTTCVIILWREDVTSMITSVSTLRLLLEILCNLKEI